MQFKSGFVAGLIFMLPIIGFSQKADSVVNKLDSLKKQSDTTGQVNLIEPGFYDERTKVNARVFGTLLLNDFKQQALSPLDIRGKGWLTGAALVGATVGISFLDKPIQEWAAGMRRRNDPNLGHVSKTLSDIGGVYQVGTFAGIAAYGFIFKNSKLRTTTALATQSYITSTFWSTLFKTLSGRLRPHDINENSNLNMSRFHGPFYAIPYGSNSAFPSGHTTLAFAAARVYAMEYKNVPAIPYISYGMASLIGLSRIIENRHWATDVFAGALLGLACGTQVVNNYHRYARLVRTGKVKKKKGDISLNLQYMPGAGLMPGMVYKFR
ncbi:MAG: phosphoesterase PA-phosphatase related protein [Segetibacter sp.]|jgi:membrane-associated phospholipid phosphatase|nr:phosphoesterase PA-phosphatase related protein [Segetibacter sp.]